MIGFFKQNEKGKSFIIIDGLDVDYSKYMVNAKDNEIFDTNDFVDYIEDENKIKVLLVIFDVNSIAEKSGNSKVLKKNLEKKPIDVLNYIEECNISFALVKGRLNLRLYPEGVKKVLKFKDIKDTKNLTLYNKWGKKIIQIV